MVIVRFHRALEVLSFVVLVRRLADRSSSTWTMGQVEESPNKNQGAYSFNVVDPWSVCLFGFLEKDKILSLCPMVILHSWPIVYTRLNSLYLVVDPT